MGADALAIVTDSIAVAIVLAGFVFTGFPGERVEAFAGAGSNVADAVVRAVEFAFLVSAVSAGEAFATFTNPVGETDAVVGAVVGAVLSFAFATSEAVEADALAGDTGAIAGAVTRAFRVGAGLSFEAGVADTFAAVAASVARAVVRAGLCFTISAGEPRVAVALSFVALAVIRAVIRTSFVLTLVAVEPFIADAFAFKTRSIFITIIPANFLFAEFSFEIAFTVTFAVDALAVVIAVLRTRFFRAVEAGEAFRAFTFAIKRVADSFVGAVVRADLLRAVEAVVAFVASAFIMRSTRAESSARAVVRAHWDGAVDAFEADFALTFAFEAFAVIGAGVRTGFVVTRGAGKAVFAETFAFVAESSFLTAAVVGASFSRTIFSIEAGFAETFEGVHVANSVVRTVIRTPSH